MPPHEQWLQRADYDGETAEAMYASARYIYKGVSGLYTGDTPVAYSKDDALTIAKAFVGEAARRHDMTGAYLFGSFVNWRQKAHSDIDLAIIIGGASASPEWYAKEAVEIFHEAQEYNAFLEVICFRKEELEENGASIIGRIKREGVPVEIR